jgi:glycosyltransferase involved in cell wall biosynthesis
VDKYPKISIITPSLNCAKFLQHTILSVVGQGYPNLEYFVIDGGSTDGSLDIIKKYQHQITYWVSEKDEGMYHAVQKGFRMSTGEVMGWINSDDILHQGSLFILAQIFNDFKNISWVQGAPNVVDEKGNIVGIFPRPEVSRLFFYNKNRDLSKYIQQESTFWRRSLWEKAGSHVSTAFRFAGDFELWIRFFQHETLYNINALLGSFRVRSSGQASIENFSAYISETDQILEKFPLSKTDRQKMVYMRIAEKAENRIFQVVNKIKEYTNLLDKSASNGQIYFDYKTQRFKMKR